MLGWQSPPPAPVSVSSNYENIGPRKSGPVNNQGVKIRRQRRIQSRPPRSALHRPELALLLPETLCSPANLPAV